MPARVLQDGRLRYIDMQTPLQITFRGTTRSDALDRRIRESVEKLNQIFAGIISCHVVVDMAGHHHASGSHYHVSINLGLPGHELLVTRAPREGSGVERAYATSDRAFEDAEHQLTEWLRNVYEHGGQKASLPHPQELSQSATSDDGVTPATIRS
jgi:ribosome-associated translation inhibitor RaiA